MEKLSAIEIRDLFLKGEKTAEEIVKFFLNRIDTYDSQIGAFNIVFHQRALEKARTLDKRKQSGDQANTFGKLAAVPIAIKDNINIKGELTTCSSKFLTNFTAPFDSTVVRLIENEDAIIIGKTNLDEFAMGSSTENSALKITRNPWNLNRAPGGSSGGSAAAVAAGFCPIALGSDTGGSIRQPASLCGIVGFKPTYGRVSRFGLVAFGSSLDQIGPMTMNTEDAALMMEILGQHCDRDSTSLPLPAERYLEKVSDGTTQCGTTQCGTTPYEATKSKPKNLTDTKIGVPWEFLKDLQPEPKKIFMDSIETLKKLGATIVDIDLSILKTSIPVYYILATAEASTNLARFDGVRYGVRAPEAKTLKEVYDLSKEQGFGREVKRRILLGTFVLSAGYQDAFYKKAQKVRTLIIQNYKKAFESCDLVAMPVAPSVAFELNSKKDPVSMYLEDIYTISANLAGLPAISIPNGFNSEELPIGLQLIGPQKQDTLVLQVAHAFEKATSFHEKKPDMERNIAIKK